MRRPMDCLATAVAAVLDLDELDLPWTGGEDWDAAVADLRRFLAARGWRLAWSHYEDTPFTVAEILADAGKDDDPVERDLIWMVSCSHPSFGGDRHVLVCQGGQVIFDPSPSTPPTSELAYHGGILLQPIDPARLVLIDQKYSDFIPRWPNRVLQARVRRMAIMVDAAFKEAERYRELYLLDHPDQRNA